MAGWCKYQGAEDTAFSSAAVNAILKNLVHFPHSFVTVSWHHHGSKISIILSFSNCNLQTGNAVLSDAVHFLIRFLSQCHPISKNTKH
jgi:hypothetical protein